MEELGEYSPSGVLSAECFTSLNSISLSKKRSKNKKRFSDEQIKSLETIFESESKLEPRKKLQLARELGLQPRQVAIWFQNKRARWKSKQLERDYSILRDNYNTLATQFEILKKEKQSLLIKLQTLNDLVEKSPEYSRKEVAENRSIDHGGKSNSGDDDDGDDDKREFQVKPSLSLSLERSDHGVGVLSEDDNENSSIRADYFGLDEEPTHLLSIVEPEPEPEPEPADDGSFTSPENWGSLNSIEFYDHSNTSCHWWDFWS